MRNTLFILSVVMLLAACNSDKKVNFQEYIKNYASDPYKDALPKSQFFEIDNSKDNVVRGEDGTLIVLPAGCFVDKDGKPIQGIIKVELSEAVGATHQITANMSGAPAADGKPAQTAASVFVNATANGQQVAVNPNNPFYLEMPNEGGDADLQVFSGDRDAQGNMTWKNPIAAVKYLTAMPLELLNFYPEGFEKQVESGMPFRGHKKADKALKDSLYYSMAAYPTEGIPFWRPDVNSPTYKLGNFVNSQPAPEQRDIRASDYYCGINPTIIKTLKDKKFENTLIATREFEMRLQVIFKICNRDCGSKILTGQTILDIYINNLDKNLWELDEMAMKFFTEEDDRCFNVKPYRSFKAFANQKLTNVRDAPKDAQILRDYFQKAQAEHQQKVEAAQSKFDALVAEENKEVVQALAEYKALLEDRWVPTIKVQPSTMGWMGTIPRSTTPYIRAYEVNTPDYKDYTRVHAYTFIGDKNRLYDMDGDGKGVFYGSVDKRELPERGEYAASAVVVAYKESQAFFYTEDIVLNAGVVRVTTKLQPITTEALKTALARWDAGASRENQITTELEYQYKWAVERKKQEKDKAEWEFLQKCWKKAYPCCNWESERSYQ